MQDLRGKVAVVTGAASGIGRGIAEALADEGVNVIVADIEENPAETAADELRAKGVRSLAVWADVADPASLRRLADRSYEEFGTVHILCNNAGVYVGGPVVETDPGDWAWMLAVNLMGVVEGVKVFLPRMRAQGGDAHVVNTGSISGLYPTPNQGAYATSKYGVVAFSERLRVELEPEGIGVSVLCPSGVRTRIGESRRNRHERFGGPDFTPPPPRPDPPPANTNVLEPIEVGRLVVAGIRDNRLYIHTHSEMRERYEERFRTILADFSPLEP